MKINSKLRFALALPTLLTIQYAYPDMNGTFTGFQEVSPSHTRQFKINTYSVQVAYTQGGITINYPTLLSGNPFFTAIPFISIGIEHLNLAYAADIIASTTIVSNSTTAVTIRINKVIGANPPVEADTNDFSITIFAVGMAE